MSNEARTLLLAICSIPGVSWALIAREVLKRAPEDLDRLAAGEITEASKDAEEGPDRLCLTAAPHCLSSSAGRMRRSLTPRRWARTWSPCSTTSIPRTCG